MPALLPIAIMTGVTALYVGLGRLFARLRHPAAIAAVVTMLLAVTACDVGCALAVHAETDVPLVEAAGYAAHVRSDIERLVTMAERARLVYHLPQVAITYGGPSHAPKRGVVWQGDLPDEGAVYDLPTALSILDDYYTAIDALEKDLDAYNAATHCAYTDVAHAVAALRAEAAEGRADATALPIDEDDVDLLLSTLATDLFGNDALRFALYTASAGGGLSIAQVCETFFGEKGEVYCTLLGLDGVRMTMDGESWVLSGGRLVDPVRITPAEFDRAHLLQWAAALLGTDEAHVRALLPRLLGAWGYVAVSDSHPLQAALAAILGLDAPLYTDFAISSETADFVKAAARYDRAVWLGVVHGARVGCNLLGNRLGDGTYPASAGLSADEVRTLRADLALAPVFAVGKMRNALLYMGAWIVAAAWLGDRLRQGQKCRMVTNGHMRTVGIHYHATISPSPATVVSAWAIGLVPVLYAGCLALRVGRIAAHFATPYLLFLVFLGVYMASLTVRVIRGALVRCNRSMKKPRTTRLARNVSRGTLPGAAVALLATVLLCALSALAIGPILRNRTFGLVDESAIQDPAAATNEVMQAEWRYVAHALLGGAYDPALAYNVLRTRRNGGYADEEVSRGYAYYAYEDTVQGPTSGTVDADWRRLYAIVLQDFVLPDPDYSIALTAEAAHKRAAFCAAVTDRLYPTYRALCREGVDVEGLAGFGRRGNATLSRLFAVGYAEAITHGYAPLADSAALSLLLAGRATPSVMARLVVQDGEDAQSAVDLYGHPVCLGGVSIRTLTLGFAGAEEILDVLAAAVAREATEAELPRALASLVRGDVRLIAIAEHGACEAWIYPTRYVSGNVSYLDGTLVTYTGLRLLLIVWLRWARAFLWWAPLFLLTILSAHDRGRGPETRKKRAIGAYSGTSSVFTTTLCVFTSRIGAPRPWYPRWRGRRRPRRPRRASGTAWWDVRRKTRRDPPRACARSWGCPRSPATRR